jgi:hypothetical protein
MYVLARAVGGTGTFDDTLALVGPAVAGCTLFTLIPDLTIGVLLNTGLLDADAWLRDVTQPSVTLSLVWAYVALYAVAFLTVFSMVVAAGAPGPDRARGRDRLGELRRPLRHRDHLRPDSREAAIDP